MNKKETLEIVNQVFYNIFERENPWDRNAKNGTGNVQGTT